MVDPVSSASISRAGTAALGGSSAQGAAPAPEESFAATLRGQLEKVSQMQTEADTGIQNVLTGQSQNITEVFAAARKAEVAFSLLMEIRNKLADAYTEIKRMQV